MFAYIFVVIILYVLFLYIITVNLKCHQKQSRKSLSRERQLNESSSVVVSFRKGIKTRFPTANFIQRQFLVAINATMMFQ